ncbi:hypothetical protein F2Q69_00033458 [Brassica cretica]|uniref:AAA+ ATPase domain-containing protein n=1 Tax=Brassica cretica TaxID=69181 RepID=A0A8S9SJE3_BRACR|nr:hypothetical protein F2Q69_00033458 [Brassica cretica]
MAALKRQLMSPMSTIVTSKDGARKLGFVSRLQGMCKSSLYSFHYLACHWNYIFECAIFILVDELIDSTRPYAELWMGTHESGPSYLEDDADGVTLRSWIAENPEALGEMGIEEAAHVPNVYHSYIKRWCKETGVCEPVTGNVQGTELPEQCDDDLLEKTKDLVGQNLVVQALSNAVARRKLGVLYVFHGPNGTGKTSCARIFARALNCHSSEQQKPCGVCTSCVSHEMGKSWNIREVGPVDNIMDLLDGNNSVTVSSHSPRVFIFDDCDTLSSDSWSAVSKVVDRAAPRRVVFILVCSSLDVLPHVIISRCQKFFFPKLKDADIVYSLQWIASKEEIEIEKDALKLIASRSDGSLRDAEMTLEQLSLLGQRISVPLVQELVGLVSDEKLVDLLDLALSADTVNTVKNLRTIMETSVEPLALMSQLATVITDILAGSYDLTKDQHRRKFFRRQPCEFLTFLQYLSDVA